MKAPFRLPGCALFFVASLATPVTWSQSVTEQAMAADAHPSFAVAVIKPSDPNSQIGESFESEGHHLQCRNATLIDIIAVVYGLQLRQIVGAEPWLSKDKFDITGTPDVPGVPDTAQFREMYQKLLADRFHLTLHRETREMSIYAITVAKGGPRLKAADPWEPVNAGNAGGIERTMKFTNMSMQEFARNLALFEDRPVVDQTALSGEYDFTLQWTSQVTAETLPDAAPALSTAMQEQLGLRLESTRGKAEVLVIDRVERPSEN
jgi:uncharacterized protein (TIGR03435 family)